MKKDLPIVSIITVNLNGKSFLDDCFSSLEALEYPSDNVETIMVDNGSTDGSVAYVKTRFPKVRVLENDTNNYCRANNLGIQSSRGQYVALINNDVKVDPGWLSALVKAMEEDAKLGAAGSKIMFMDGSLESFGHKQSHDFYWHDIGFGDTDLGKYSTRQQVDSICGCSVLYRRKCLDEVGLLDEDFVLYVEDVDMGIRCTQKGWKLASCPESIIYHKFHGTIKDEEAARRWQETNRLLLIAKHWPEKLVDALYGKGYFTVKSDDGSLRDMSEVLGRVFIKIAKEHGLARLSELSPELFKALYRLYRFEKEYLVEELKSKRLVLSTEDAQLAQKIQEMSLLSLEKDQRLSSAQKELSILAEQKDRVIAEKAQELSSKDQELDSLKRELAILAEQKEQQLNSAARDLSLKAQQLDSIKKELAILAEQKDRVIAQKAQELSLRDQQLDSVKKELSLKEQQLDSVTKELSLKEQQLVSVKRELAILTEQKDQVIAEQKQKLSLLSGQLALAKEELIVLAGQKDQVIAEKDKEVLFKGAQLAEREREIEVLQKAVNASNDFLKAKEKELASIYSSTGYRFLLVPLWNCFWPVKKLFELRSNKRFMQFYHSDTVLSLILQKIYRFRDPWLKIYHHHLKFGTFPPVPNTLILMLTRRCNLSCKFCNIENTPEEMSTADACKIIDKACALGVKEIIITGGEPLLHKGIFEIAGHARASGIKSCITTNGVLIDEYFEKIVSSGVDVVSVSLDGIGPAHDKLRAKPGLAKTVQRDLLRLKERGVIVSINFVLTRENVDELEPAHEWARSNGIYFDFWPVNHCRELFISPDGDFNRVKRFAGKLKNKRLISASKYRYYLNMPFYLKDDKGLQVRCLALARNIGVDTNGNVTTCCVWNRKKIDLGNVLVDDLETLWHSREYLAVRRELFTKGCSADCYNVCLPEFSSVTGKDFMFVRGR